MGDIFGGLLKFKYFLGMLEIPDIFWGRIVDAGSQPTYEEKMRVPPWGAPLVLRPFNHKKTFCKIINVTQRLIG